MTMHIIQGMLVPSVLPREFLLYYLETFMQSSKVAIIYLNLCNATHAMLSAHAAKLLQCYHMPS